MIDKNKHFPIFHWGGHWPVGHWPKLKIVVRYVRSLLLLDSPAAIVRRALVLASVGSMPSANSDWPVFVSHLPDDESLDDAMCVYDQAPYQHGELVDGQQIEHKGVGVTIRCQSYQRGLAKFAGLVTVLDDLFNEVLSLGVNEYEIANAVQVRLSFYGRDSSRRSRFACDYWISLYRRVTA